MDKKVDEAMTKAFKALTFAKPMVGALCAEAKKKELRDQRTKVYIMIQQAIEALQEAKMK